MIRLAMLELVVLSVLTAGCLSRPLLYDVKVAPDVISPNADGRDDVTRVEYKLRRSADLSIYFLNAEGEKHYTKPRTNRGSQSETDLRTKRGLEKEHPLLARALLVSQRFFYHILRRKC